MKVGEGLQRNFIELQSPRQELVLRHWFHISRIIKSKKVIINNVDITTPPKPWESWLRGVSVTYKRDNAFAFYRCCQS